MKQDIQLHPIIRSAFMLLMGILLVTCNKDEEILVDDKLSVLLKTINGNKVDDGAVSIDTEVEIQLVFSHTLNKSNLESALSFSSANGSVDYDLSYSNTNSTVSIVNKSRLAYETIHTIKVDPGVLGDAGEELKEPFSLSFKTVPFVPANITLSSDVSVFSEDGGTAKIVATLSEALTEDVSVTLSYGGTAVNNTDYTTGSEKIVITAGNLNASLDLNAVQDSELEGAESIIIGIEHLENAVELTPQELTLTLNDDDIDTNGDGVPDRGFIINEVLFDPPSGSAGDANGDGTRSASEDEFIEFVNDSNKEIDLSGYTLYDETNLALNEPRHIFPANTIIPPGGVYVLFGGGNPTGDFGGAMVGASTSGNMNLNNAGDAIIIKDTNGNVVLYFSTSDDGAGLDFGADQSVTRSPDVNGSFVLHTTANSALAFSPGTKADGTALGGAVINIGRGFIINEVLFDPPSGDAGDANGDGTRSASEDEFIEFINDSNQAIDLSGFTLFDDDNLATNEPRHIFPPNTVIPPGGVYVLFGGGVPAGDFGGAIVAAASTGNMNLNNAGDAITIKDTNGNVFLIFSTSDEGAGINFGADQSVTRSPDVTGEFVLHTTANGALLFSPGRRTDGSSF